MKIALQLSGQIRKIEESIPSIEIYIIKPNN